MSVRIYALAKELGIDNKELLGACEKLGIKGKGSALASLDDDEVTRIKQQIAGGGEPEKPVASSVEAALSPSITLSPAAASSPSPLLRKNLLFDRGKPFLFAGVLFLFAGMPFHVAVRFET